MINNIFQRKINESGVEDDGLYRTTLSYMNGTKTKD
jgi:hypothetical protein